MIAIVPSEVSVSWLYLPPVLIVVILGILGGWIIGRVLNRTRLSRFFWHPPLAMLAFAAIVGSLVGLFVLAP